MSESLRDQLSQAFDEHVEQEPAQTTPAAEVSTPTQEPQQDAEAGQSEQKPGRTYGRPRDEKGRLLPGKAAPKENSAAEPGKAPLTQTPTAQASQAAPAAEPQRPPRPSSWKKDYWEHWDKLDPKVAEYINQRESEAIKGVSTYKAEYDRLKPLDNAMAEFMPLLQQNGIQPDQWIKNLGSAHRALAMGRPEEKLSMFMKLAQDYQVPLQNLFAQGQDGRFYFNPQVQAYQPPQQAQQPVDVSAAVRQALAEEKLHQTIAEFEAQAPTKYPHYEAVKQTMAGLLQAELAQDLEDAYQQALKHPRHSDIYAQIQEQETRAKAEQVAAEKAKQVARAKSQAVSPRSATPTATPGKEAKGIRAALENAFDEHAGSGRV